GRLADAVLLRILRRELAGPFAEDEQVRQGVAAKSIGTVDADSALARREQTGDARHLRVTVHADSAHDVMGRRPNLHRLRGDVDVAQLLELVVHARQLALDVLGLVQTRLALGEPVAERLQLQEDAAMW